MYKGVMYMNIMKSCLLLVLSCSIISINAQEAAHEKYLREPGQAGLAEKKQQEKRQTEAAEREKEQQKQEANKRALERWLGANQ